MVEPDVLQRLFSIGTGFAWCFDLYLELRFRLYFRLYFDLYFWLHFWLHFWLCFWPYFWPYFWLCLGLWVLWLPSVINMLNSWLLGVLDVFHVVVAIEPLQFLLVIDEPLY